MSSSSSVSTAIPREMKEKQVTSNVIKPLGKSHKSIKRDKPKHSSKLHSGPKKGGGGKGTVWGKPTDDVKFLQDSGALDKNDPNYIDDEEEYEFDEAMFAPPNEEKLKFASSIQDLNKFKKAVKAATEEFFTSDETKEFIQVIKDLSFPIYHQEIPPIMIKLSLDHDDNVRQKVCALLKRLVEQGIISSSQMSAGWTKLYHSLPDLLIDSPNARTLAKACTEQAVKLGFLDEKVAKKLLEGDAALSDTKNALAAKAKIDTIVSDYYGLQNPEETVRAIADMKNPHFHFEIIKKLISAAFDKDNKDRELASRLLARVSGDVISTDEVCKGFGILLQRVEDLFLDVPDILQLFSCFLARAVADEALPPAFLIRQDLDCNDMGYKVLSRTQNLLQGKGISYSMARVWVEPPEEDSDDNTKEKEKEKGKEKEKETKESKETVKEVKETKKEETKKEETKKEDTTATACTSSNSVKIKS
eukprot:TRINITY_DN79_c0_g1_i2.p1 TRINITY_DN79_c0_g1~~TRINITY_DN79_c0_g1_i2.p1  ORF type:complete len:483 (-),score=149.52 TRINITY_DN79_c0_g1_i2:223-1644(-)